MRRSARLFSRRDRNLLNTIPVREGVGACMRLRKFQIPIPINGIGTSAASNIHPPSSTSSAKSAWEVGKALRRTRRNFKFKAPIGKKRLGVWSLELLWNLEFGIWNLITLY